MDILFNQSQKQGKTEVGQVRYNDKMYVLIVYSRNSFACYDAVVLSECTNVKKYDWNTKNADSETIERIYPYIADATLEISN